MHIIKKIITIFASLLSLHLLVGCDGDNQQQVNTLRNFKILNNYRAWQGIAADDNYIYCFTDRNESFGLENIISIYTHDGRIINEYRNIYTGKDEEGNFMSFGDGNIIDGSIYITAYNINSGARISRSQVLIYTLPDLILHKTYDIGSGVAESVTKKLNYFYVTYHDDMIVKEFDTSFNEINSYTLSESYSEYGGYQGSFWVNNDFYVQMHGPNKANLNPSKGLDKYKFDGNTFIFLKTLESIGYGAGQGVSVYKNYILQNDRPGNGVIVKELNIF